MKNLGRMSLGLVTLVTLSFSGCGGGSSSSDDTKKETLKGIFLDSPVEGLTYDTGAKSGLTDTNGTFEYLKGENVTFSIGGIILGTTRALDVVTPQEVAGVTTVKNSKAQDMLVLLQTLDADHNASNGIVIDKATRATSNSMDVNFIEDTIDIDTIINQFGIDQSYKVSDTDAMAHFENTLRTEYPPQGLKFTNEIVKNKSFYKIFVKDDKTTVIYVKATFNDSTVTFTYGTKDDFINNETGHNTVSYSIDSNGILTNDKDKWELLKIEDDKIIILNTSDTDDDGNNRPEVKSIEKWLIKKPVGFP